jgi:hypothetical protein
MKYQRRDLLKSTLFGASGLGLRALATGLPVSFLSRPLMADDYVCPDKNKAQYLILSASSAGDPLNANVPGTYDFPDIAHSADPRMAPTPITLSGKEYVGAQVWSTLAPWVADRTVFFHHATYTNNHANLSKTLKLMGQTARQEMMPSIFAKYMAPCFGTVQVDPISAGAGDVLSIDGRSLPNIAPTGLRDLLASPKTPLTRLQPLRDAALDEVHTMLKERGTVAQRLYLDRLAMSRQQARTLGADLVDMLAGIRGNGADGQITAAVALIKMNVSPVITISIPFGGDNHTDNGLTQSEVPQTENGIKSINTLMETLRVAGLQDRVTFAAYNVFGRTLKKNGVMGRDHWASHHATVMIGSGLKGGVIGGLEPKSGDYYATPIDSASGAGVPGGGDIGFNETLAAMGKTLGAAMGLPAATLERHIGGGKIVRAALVG